MNIGNVKLANPYILAPMAGVTDLPFRLLCKEQGAGLLCMEMISAKALQYKNRNTKALLEIAPEEYPVSLQLFGSDPQIISEQAKAIEETAFSDPGYQHGMSSAQGGEKRGGFGADAGSGKGLCDRQPDGEGHPQAGDGEDPERLRRCPCQCGGDRPGGRSSRGGRGGGPRAHP